MTRKHDLPSDQFFPSQCLFHISEVFWLSFPWKSTFLVSSLVPACLNWDGTLSCFLRALAKLLGISLLFISWEFSIKYVLSLPVCQRRKKASFHDTSTELFSFLKVSYIGALPMIGKIRFHSPLKTSSILLHLQLCIKTWLTNGKEGAEK